MVNAKKGLRLLSFSIILNILWSVVYSILGNFAEQSIDIIIKIISYGTLITSVVLLVCFVVDLLGLHFAGKDSDYFKRASFLKIMSIVGALVCFVLGLISVLNIGNDNLIRGLSLATSIINIVISVSEVIVLFSVIKGCKEIAPRVRGLATFVLICFVAQIVLSIVMTFLADSAIIAPTDGILLAIAFMAIAYAIFAVVYAIAYVLLIFRTTANVGKARK